MKNKKEKIRVCDDTCDNCLYIGEGDFICEEAMEIVIDDWCPVYGTCILERKKDAYNEEQ